MVSAAAASLSPSSYSPCRSTAVALTNWGVKGIGIGENLSNGAASAMRLIRLAMTGAAGSALAMVCVAWVPSVSGIGPLAIDGTGAEKTDSTADRWGIAAAKVVALKADAVVALPPPLG